MGMDTFEEWRHLGNGDIWGMETFGEWRHLGNGEIWEMETLESMERLWFIWVTVKEETEAGGD